MKQLEKAIFIILLLGGVVTGFYFGNINSKRYRSEIEQYRESQETLMQGLNKYMTSDSLKAVEIGVLNLRLDEYKYFRSQDAKTIESLRIKNRDLQNITAMQSEMLANISSPVVDTVVVYLDESGGVTKDTLQRVDYHDDWLDFHGTIRDNTLSADIEMRDSLIIVESVTYKRFLGFLWKTKRVKDRKIDAVSKNPYNHIQSLEKVQIVK